jgi:hypothetical protein
LLAGVAGLVLPATAEADSPPATSPQPQRKARLEAARRGLEQFDQGSAATADSSLVRLWARRVADAELALCARPAGRKAILEAYVRRARDAERAVRAGYRKGAVALAEVLEAEFFRADAEAGAVDALYERVRARLLAEPERYAFRYILVAVLLTRR